MPREATPEFNDKANAVIARLSAAVVGEDMGLAIYCLHWFAAYTIGTQDGDKRCHAALVRAGELGGNVGYTNGVMRAHGYEGKPS
jgi:hypothetical protein